MYRILGPMAILVIFQNVVNGLSTGDLCHHEEKRTSGVCKPLTSCFSAIVDLRFQKPPQNCGFVGSFPIVCCPENPIDPPEFYNATIAQNHWSNDKSAVFGQEDVPNTTTTTKAPSTGTATKTLPVGVKSVRACKFFERFGYTKSLSPELMKNRAGYEYVESCLWEVKGLSVIFGGEKCNEGEFPHMALIGYGNWSDNYSWGCGGSLISEKFVLTAAHCSHMRKFGSAKFVRLGDVDYSNANDDEHAQQIEVKKVHKHPGYNRTHRYSDLALLELIEPAKLNLYVKPGCLYVDEGVEQKEPMGIVTGWGKTENSQTSSRLLKTVVEMFPTSRCKKTYQHDTPVFPMGIDKSLQLCYGSNVKRKGICLGDSGGPIQIYAQDTYCSYYIFGVTSRGKSCAFRGIAAIYVKVSPHIEWIERIVWP